MSAYDKAMAEEPAAQQSSDSDSDDDMELVPASAEAHAEWLEEEEQFDGAPEEAPELPAPKLASLAVGDAPLRRVGVVESLILEDRTLVVRGEKGAQAVVEDSVLCLADRRPLGAIAEVFGPVFNRVLERALVVEPFYMVRLADDADAAAVSVYGAAGGVAYTPADRVGYLRPEELATPGCDVADGEEDDDDDADEALREAYARRGFHFPARACSAAEARAALEAVEGLEGEKRFKPHLYLPTVNRIARAPGVLEAVRAVLGCRDVFLWSSDVNSKAPGSETYFSPHQDSTYAGLEPPADCCTVWVALSENVGEASGGLAFAAGSHVGGQRPHAERPVPTNALSRGQVCECDGPWTHQALAAGEMSLHSFHCVHASGPNRSGAARAGSCVRVLPSPRHSTLVEELPVGLALRFAAVHVHQTGPARESCTVFTAAPPGFAIEPVLPAEPSAADLRTGRSAHAAALAAERTNYFPQGGEYR